MTRKSNLKMNDEMAVNGAILIRDLTDLYKPDGKICHLSVETTNGR